MQMKTIFKYYFQPWQSHTAHTVILVTSAHSQPPTPLDHCVGTYPTSFLVFTDSSAGDFLSYCSDDFFRSLKWHQPVAQPQLNTTLAHNAAYMPNIKLCLNTVLPFHLTFCIPTDVHNDKTTNTMTPVTTQEFDVKVQTANIIENDPVCRILQTSAKTLDYDVD